MLKSNIGKTTREKEFEEFYDMSYGTWGTFQDIARRDVRAVTKDVWTEDDIRKARIAGVELYSYPMIRRIVKLMGGYYRKNGTSIKFEAVGLEDEKITTQLNKINTKQLKSGHAYNVLGDSFEHMLVSGINLVNTYQTRDWDCHLKRYPYNSFVLDPNFSQIDLSDCHGGILRQKLTQDMVYRLLPGREKEIKRIATKKKEGGRDGKFPNMPDNHNALDMLMNYDEWQRRITQKKKFFIWTAGPKAGQWFKADNGDRTEWKGSEQNLKIILQSQPYLDLMEDWVENIEVTVFLEGHEIANEIDPWGIGDFSYTPMMGFWVPEEDDIRYKLQGIVRSLIDPQRAQDKERNYILNMWMQQIGSGLDFQEGDLVDPRDAFATGNKPRMFTKEAGMNHRDRTPPPVPPSTAQHNEQIRGLMPEIVNLNDEIFGTVDGKSQIAGFLGKLRQNSAIVGLSDLLENAAYTQAVIGKKLLKLYQKMPPHIVQRIINEEPAEGFYNKEFGQYDAVSVEGVRTDTQRSAFYQELIMMKQMGASMNDPAPISWNLIFRNAPVSIRGELLEEVARIEKQNEEAGKKVQANQETQRKLANAALLATVNSENSQSAERQSQLEVDQVTNAYNRAKTIAEIQEIQTRPALEAAKIAAALEKERIKAGSNNGGKE